VGKLGTFGGVFTPSILTILGIILFMRLGYVVGNAGLKYGLLIILGANAISMLTTFSLSAIATNLKVKGGGDYYLISRTLGVEFGGAIGIVLFLAQAISIGFYCIGFGEAIGAMIPDAATSAPQLIALAAAAALFLFAWLGSDWATKLQLFIMAALFASITSFFIGGIAKWDSAVLAESWRAGSQGVSFSILFAIFFPAVTGFTQGVSMSGDLKNPGHSIPRGTFLAVGISIVVYICAALVFAAGMSAEELSRDNQAMNRLALFDWLVSVGVVAATLSSAMASFLGAPRILQALARDRIFPVLLPFAKGSGPAENPRRGVMLSAGIAAGVIALGELNMIAPIVSMFFLISYGLLNYATYFEAQASSPSFRPRFRFFHRRLSLLGAVGCLAAMLAIDIWAGLAAAAVLVAIFQYLKRTAGPARWADSQRSYHFQRLRAHLLALAAEPEHPRDWRPRLLVFSKEAKRRRQLLRFSSWIEGRSGLTTAVQILEGRGAKMRKLQEEASQTLRAHIAEEGVEAYHLVVTAPNLLVGAQILLQSYGIGPVDANTVILNWLEQVAGSDAAKGKERYGRYLMAAMRLGCNVVILDTKEDEWAARETTAPNERRIDVWWWDDATGRLMLLLAYLMTRSEEWSEASIRVIGQSATPDVLRAQEELEAMLSKARIDAEAQIAPIEDRSAMIQRSAGSTLVFLPFRVRNYHPIDPFGQPLEDLLECLPIVALVSAGEDIPLDADPEEGEAGDAAALLDAADDAHKKAEETERAAAKAEEVVSKKLVELHNGADSFDEEQRREIEKEVAKARDVATKAARKAAKNRIKADDAASKVEESLRNKTGKKED